MSNTKKSVDEIWKELNAAKPKPRQGVAGLAVGLSGIPGVTSVVLTKPATATASATAPSSTLTSIELDPSPPEPPTQPVCADTASYLSTLQRTVNCLADPDRGLRRTAAGTLHSKLFTGDASTPAASASQLQSLLCDPGPLSRPVVAMLADPVERVRAVGLSILTDALPRLSDASGLLPELMPQLARRFGALPVQETGEEVRLQIIQLLLALLASPPSVVPPSALGAFTPELSSVLCRALEDPFPDIKKAAAGALEAAAAHGRLAAPDALVAESERLLTSLVPCLQHAHSRVRLAAVAAMDALVGGGTAGAGGAAGAAGTAVRRAPVALLEGPLVAGALRPVAHDRSQQVREAAFCALARWMGCPAQGGHSGQAGLGQEDGARPRGGEEGGAAAAQAAGDPGAARAAAPALLPLLLVGVTDPQPAAAALALALVEGVGAQWLRGGGADGAPQGPPPGSSGAERPADDEGAAAAAAARRVAACGLDAPYAGRPGAGCRAMVAALLGQHLPPLVRQLGEWTAALRVAAARGLHTTLVLAEGAAAAHLARLLPALCSAISDDELPVASLAVSCVHVLGAHVPPAAWLPYMLDTLSCASCPAPSESAASAGGAAAAAGADAAAAGGGGGMRVSQRVQALVVLSGLMHAAGRAGQPLPAALLPPLAAVLAEEASLAAAAEHAKVRQQLLAAAANAMAWAGPGVVQEPSVVRHLHLLLLHLYGIEMAAAGQPAAAGGTDGGGGAAGAVLAAMGRLAECCGPAGAEPGRGDSSAGTDDAEGTTGPERLTEGHAEWLMQLLFDASSSSSSSTPPSPAPAWRPQPGDATWLPLLRGLLLTCSPPALAALAPRLASSLRPLVSGTTSPTPSASETAPPTRTPAAAPELSLRLALLGLMDAVLEDGRRGEALARGAGSALLRDVLLPPMVWQAGKTAAAVRHAACTALATALGRRLPEPGELAALVEAGAVLPQLSTALDDDWYTDLRLAACYVVEQLLRTCGHLLSDASRRALYPELHKRLDDAHNGVRVAACGALEAFVAAAGPGYCDTNSGYLVAGVVIHMDDSDPAVQEAACRVLLAAAATKPRVAAAEVRKARERFRCKHLCDRVLSAAEQAEQAEQAAEQAAAQAAGGAA